MVKDLTLIHTTYKATQVHGESSYPDLLELFGDKLLTDERSCKRRLHDGEYIVVHFNDTDQAVPVGRGTYVVVEYLETSEGTDITSVIVADNVQDLREMFTWEGDL